MPESCISSQQPKTPLLKVELPQRADEEEKKNAQLISQYSREVCAEIITLFKRGSCCQIENNHGHRAAQMRRRTHCCQIQQQTILRQQKKQVHIKRCKADSTFMLQNLSNKNGIYMNQQCIANTFFFQSWFSGVYWKWNKFNFVNKIYGKVSINDFSQYCLKELLKAADRSPNREDRYRYRAYFNSLVFRTARTQGAKTLIFACALNIGEQHNMNAER